MVVKIDDTIVIMLRNMIYFPVFKKFFKKIIDYRGPLR